MIQNIVSAIAMLLIFTFPAYILPLILRLVMRDHYREDELSRLASYFTLKPLLAAPLWSWIVGLNSPDLYRFLSLIPAISLTLFILLVCRGSLRANKGLIILFLIADALRPLNTLAWLYNNPTTRFHRIATIGWD